MKQILMKQSRLRMCQSPLTFMRLGLLFFVNGELCDSVIGLPSPRAPSAQVEALTASVEEAKA